MLVTSVVTHSNVSYRVSHRGPCIEICIVSWENVSLQPSSHFGLDFVHRLKRYNYIAPAHEQRFEENKDIKTETVNVNFLLLFASLGKRSVGEDNSETGLHDAVHQTVKRGKMNSLVVSS